MITALRQHAARYARNIRGWRTHRKIVVIESDDWGSIRMPSRKVYEQCLKAGYRVDNNPYESYDSLASEDDLELLFDLLNGYKDKNGNAPVITANILPANPDFEEIEANGFQKYHYELVTETFKQYPQHSRCFELWKKGKETGIFFPQSHGREHLNVSLFMQDLYHGKEEALFGFNHNMPGSIPKENPDQGNKYVVSLEYGNPTDKEEKLSIVLEGLRLFETLMGYHSKSFIPPNYIWSPDFDEQMATAGVQFYQGQKKLKEPRFNGSLRLHSHYLGDNNEFDQINLMRNCFFEPTLFGREVHAVDKCLKDVQTAFRMKKPAIISTHRLNYVGFIDERNRDQNLTKLTRLLTRILKWWPDVEFLNSVQLGNVIAAESE